MEIATYTFRYGRTDNPFEVYYQLIRSEEDEQEVQVVYTTKGRATKTRISKFITNKTDEEMVHYFNKKFDEYQTIVVTKKKNLVKAFYSGKFFGEFQRYFRQNILK